MDDPYREQRRLMVIRQLEPRGITDPRVLDAMGRVPRHEFVPAAARDRAYRDGPLPIGHGQTISQPYMVAVMTQSARIRPEHRVLEIGTGCGYQAAVLSLLARQVFTVERIPELAHSAGRRLERLGYTNVSVAQADGTIGLPAEAPFDAILVTAGAPSVPDPLLEQLAVGGRLVIPVQEGLAQVLYTCVRGEEGVERNCGEACTFVPLIGEHGWSR